MKRQKIEISWEETLGYKRRRPFLFLTYIRKLAYSITIPLQEFYYSFSKITAQKKSEMNDHQITCCLFEIEWTHLKLWILTSGFEAKLNAEIFNSNISKSQGHWGIK